jgi:hypothetical protein
MDLNRPCWLLPRLAAVDLRYKAVLLRNLHIALRGYFLYAYNAPKQPHERKEVSLLFARFGSQRSLSTFCDE